MNKKVYVYNGRTYADEVSVRGAIKKATHLILPKVVKNWIKYGVEIREITSGSSATKPISYEQQVKELKQKLFDTDYVVIKIAEGAATTDEYSSILDQRKEWRREINYLEAVIEENK